ncbi:MAG TPA: BrxA/BrxB family bacilliredoxin [Gemmatimonadaceae bacterium]|nr:BrxA/BrxB family bacilliredoxin [Gemmatimonadaceae bacterium]
MRLPMSAGMYPEELVQPMRAELTQIGFEELKSAGEVDEKLKEKGTTLVVVNSICGCAARMARPAVRIALEGAPARPEHLTTVFAGQDREATDRAREHFTGYPPSSPSIALLKDGELVFMLERWQIEGRPAPAIAQDLAAAFQEHCAP